MVYAGGVSANGIGDAGMQVRGQGMETVVS